MYLQPAHEIVLLMARMLIPLSHLKVNTIELCLKFKPKPGHLAPLDRHMVEIFQDYSYIQYL